AAVLPPPPPPPEVVADPPPPALVVVAAVVDELLQAAPRTAATIPMRTSLAIRMGRHVSRRRAIVKKGERPDGVVGASHGGACARLRSCLSRRPELKQRRSSVGRPGGPRAVRATRDRRAC